MIEEPLHIRNPRPEAYFLQRLTMVDKVHDQPGLLVHLRTLQAAPGRKFQKLTATTVSSRSENGTLGGTRTRNLSLRRAALYPLSYKRTTPHSAGPWLAVARIGWQLGAEGEI